MKAREFLEMGNEIFDIQELEKKEIETAKKLLDFAEKIGEIEADRGAEGVAVITELLDNNFTYDREDQLQFAENVIGEKLNPTSSDIENAKKLWFLKEMTFYAKEVLI